MEAPNPNRTGDLENLRLGTIRKKALGHVSAAGVAEHGAQ